MVIDPQQQPTGTIGYVQLIASVVIGTGVGTTIVGLIFARKLEVLRADLQKLAGARGEKTALYKSVVDIIAAMVAEIRGGAPVPQEERVARHIALYKDRLRTWGYLAMVAPQTVMDRHDRMIDYLVPAHDRDAPFDFANRFRPLAIQWLNAVRADLDIDPTPIAHSGDV